MRLFGEGPEKPSVETLAKQTKIAQFVAERLVLKVPGL